MISKLVVGVWYSKNTKWVLTLASVILAFLLFTSEVWEADSGKSELVGRFDKVTIATLSEMRNPVLTNIAIEVSALGSVTILAIAVLVGALLFSLSKKYLNCGFLTLTMTGAGLLSQILKSSFERSRPPLADHLVQVQGFSYPSGHSLGGTVFYLILAFLVTENFHSRTHKFVIFSVLIILILVIGLSRIYLGVHYPTDVVAGIMMGSVWAIFSYKLKLEVQRLGIADQCS